MHEEVKLVGCILHLGYHRGSYKLTVRNLGSWKRQQIYESNSFQIAGFSWRLALYSDFRNSGPRETIRVVLLSCNDVAVSADVNLSVSMQEKATDSLPARKRRVACPYSHIERQYIYPNQLMNSEKSQFCDTLVVTVDLKNVRNATHEEQRSAAHDMRTVHIEVIDRESINKALSGGTQLAIAPTEHKRNSDVCSRSFARLWAQQPSDCRYWLCERQQGGNVIVKRCLNETDPLKCFGSICTEHNGVPWVTVFKEKKESNEDFQHVDDKTVVVFCVLDDASFDDEDGVSYLGHILADKRMSCNDLSQRVAEHVAHLPDDQRYNVCLSEGGIYTKDITDDHTPLYESGVHSGSVLVVRTWASLEGQVSEALSQEACSCGEDEEDSSCCNDDHFEESDSRSSNSEASIDTTSSNDRNNIAGDTTSESELDSIEDCSTSGSVIDHQNEPEDDVQILGEECDRSDGDGHMSEFHPCSEDKEVSTQKDVHTPAMMDMLELNAAVTGKTEPADNVADSDEDSSMDLVQNVEEAVKGLQQAILTDVRNKLRRVKEPIIGGIQQVAMAVDDVKTTVTATYQEICKANLIADITMEQLTTNDADAPLTKRDGKEAFMMADDYVEEPIFLLSFQKDYRMRIRLTHKHQRDADNFRIKYVSVKPSDGMELGLKTSETRQPSEGSEVVGLFECDQFQSVRLSSKSPHFGTRDQRYVSLPITIGVEVGSRKLSSQSSSFELNGRILCRLSADPDFMKIRSFERFALRSWKNSPQWIRNGARGALILSSMAVDRSSRCGTQMLFPGVISAISALFVLPCFRLDARQLVE